MAQTPGLGDVHLGQLVPDAPAAGVQHDPHPAVLIDPQLEEVVARAECAELPRGLLGLAGGEIGGRVVGENLDELWADRQAWRGGSRQAWLARLLRGCDVEALDEALARPAGALAAKSGTVDVVDACVTEGALRRRDLVLSSDYEDLKALTAAVNRHLEVERP